MSAIVKKEIVVDPDGAIDNSEEEEDRFLNVYFRGSSEDVLIEEDGRVLFEDITLIKSHSVGLFIQNDAIRRLLKPVDGYFEEPKEKWESFQAFAVSRTQFEIILKERIANAGESLQNDTATAISREPVADQESPSSHNPYDQNLQSSSSLASTFAVVQSVDKTIKTESDLFDAAANHKSVNSINAQARSVTEDREIDNSILNSPFSIDIKLSSDFSLIFPKYISFGFPTAGCPIFPSTCCPCDEPTMKDVLAAYNVSSRKKLRFLLSRGDSMYWGIFDFVLKFFKRTMVAHPNNKIVRILHWIKKLNYNRMLKTLDPNASWKCNICHNGKNPSNNFGHFFSSIHSAEYHKKFNADPPEIAKFLEPEIYMKLIDRETLTSVRLSEYQGMEELPKFLFDKESSSNLQSCDPSIPTSSLASASGVVQRVKKRIVTEVVSLNAESNQESLDSIDVQVPPFNVDPVTDNSIQNAPFSADDKLSSDCSSNVLTESNAFSTTTSVTVRGQPSMKDVLDAYKVSSRHQLKLMLCRGDHMYTQTFDLVKNAFKRTMVSNPNHEIVRILHWARKSNILVKDLDSSASEECDICNIRVKTFNTSHLISQFHATQYQIKFRADPPQIAKLLQPEIYMKFIQSQKLASLKFAGYQELEQSPEFSIEGLSSGSLEDAFEYKYSLIRQILSKKLKLNYKETFSIRKLLYLKRNVHKLKDHFDEVHECKKCNKKSANTNPQSIVQHIFSPKHFKKALNQAELDFICKGLFLLDSEPEPDVPAHSMARKRVQELADDSEIESKRSKIN